MTGLKLEVFSPGAEMEMAKRENLAQKVAEAYREGHARGFAQGAEASAKEHAEAQDQLRSQFVEAFRDAQIEQAEAQRHVLSSFFPVLQSITEALAPALAEAGLLSLLEEKLRSAISKRPEAQPLVSCAPEVAHGLERMPECIEGQFRINVDPGLTPLEARLAWENGFDEINLEASLTAMRAHIEQFKNAAALATPDQETAHVG